jgi:hypothetical protein
LRFAAFPPMVPSFGFCFVGAVDVDEGAGAGGSASVGSAGDGGFSFFLPPMTPSLDVCLVGGGLAGAVSDGPGDGAGRGDGDRGACFPLPQMTPTPGFFGEGSSRSLVGLAVLAGGAGERLSDSEAVSWSSSERVGVGGSAFGSGSGSGSGLGVGVAVSGGGEGEGFLVGLAPPIVPTPLDGVGALSGLLSSSCCFSRGGVSWR